MCAILVFIVNNPSIFEYSYCRNGWNVTACILVVINDILDHVDGIVAKVHKIQYGQIDDPMFGAFIDAFCDKVKVHATQSITSAQCPPCLPIRCCSDL